MCDKEEEKMQTPVKPIKPMIVEFDNEKEMIEFYKYAENHNKTDNEKMNKIRAEFAHYRSIRRKKGS
jgi:hypothetical protein